MASLPSSAATRLNATRARQGRWGRHVLWVLIISIALAALALFGSWGLSSQNQGGSWSVRRPAPVDRSAQDAAPRTPASPNR